MDKGQIKLKPWGLGEENQLIYLIRFFYIFEEFPETYQHEGKKSFNIATFIIEERDFFFLIILALAVIGTSASINSLTYL